MSTVATADGRLIVRDLLTTLTVPREHIGSEEIDDGFPTGRAWAVFLRTHEDLRFRLDATPWPFHPPLERQAEAVRSWRDGPPGLPVSAVQTADEREDHVVTRTGEPLVIRPPGWVRVLGPVFLGVWVAAVLVDGRASYGFLVPALLIAILVVAVLVRLFFASVIGTADGQLTVRNVWSTRTFSRGEIEGVDIDRVRGRGWAVWLRLHDGERHRLDVTETPFLGPFAATLERQAAEVRAWVSNRPQPFR